MELRKWSPLPLSEIAGVFRGFEDWVLCGGHSVALFCGSDTRDHGDTDIGVLRSLLPACLAVFDPGRVFLCRSGNHEAWDGCNVPREVHDIWITDESRCHWILQIMAFDDDGERISYRRDPRITWHRKDHHLTIAGTRILNPFVTFLFKANQAKLAEKDTHDLSALIGSIRRER